MRLLVAGETLSAIYTMVFRHETFTSKFLKGLSHAANAGKEWPYLDNDCKVVVFYLLSGAINLASVRWSPSG
jgi:hypothetical protein